MAPKKAAAAAAAKNKKSKIESVVSDKKPDIVNTTGSANPEPVRIHHDKLTIKIKSLRTFDYETKEYAIKVSFFEQPLVYNVIKSIGPKDEEPDQELAWGCMEYDPANYEKMCLFADYPLVVTLQTVKAIKGLDKSQSLSAPVLKSRSSVAAHAHKSKSQTESFIKTPEGSSCNVDILSIFLSDQDNQTICVKKRMEPMITPSALNSKSWDTLPLITIELNVERHPKNTMHHKVLKNANWMQMTVVAAYNLYIPYESSYNYTAATKTPLYTESHTGLASFGYGCKEPRRFNCTNFYPKWETLRTSGELFTNGDQKLFCKEEDLQNDDNIDLDYYLNRILPYHTTVWASFHRTLMLKDSTSWFQRQIRNYKWPLELHIYAEKGGYSFMGFMNLFRLLYPGENVVRLAVPLHWINRDTMMSECGCHLLVAPNDRAPSSSMERGQGDKDKGTMSTRQSKSSKIPVIDSAPTSQTTFTGAASQVRATGADDNCAFVIVEVKLGRPIKKIVIPQQIPMSEISQMLKIFEHEGPTKRVCTGRGQLEKDWQSTVQSAANSLRKVPYYGTTEFCAFNRQLSETRTRVELTTSCWQQAAIYVNNNFVIQDYIYSDKKFEIPRYGNISIEFLKYVFATVELIMMAHACMIKSACNTLVGNNNWKEIDPTLRAARHARHMQDTYHAMESYMRLIVDRPRHACYWRELSTCLKDIDRDWANACLNKSVVLNPRHPLTLISKGAMLFEENPEAAEPFFTALLAFHPQWNVVWVIANAYFYERELFHIADVIMEFAKQKRLDRGQEDKHYARAWEHELGDWWDPTPLLPGMSPLFNAADLLLRLRAIPLAEVCVARALAETGESLTYYHLVALCCRLRGDYKDALCHIKLALEKFGEATYLRSLEAECHLREGDFNSAMYAYDQADTSLMSSPFSVLMSMPIRDDQHARTMLVDLARRQPSAYVWTSLAEDWIRRVQRSEDVDPNKTDEQIGSKVCAIASLVQALRYDRRAGRAWAELATLTKPTERRLFCLRMANMCGWEVTEKDLEQAKLPLKHAMCHRVGFALRECLCHVWEGLRM